MSAPFPLTYKMGPIHVALCDAIPELRNCHRSRKGWPYAMKAKLVVNGQYTGSAWIVPANKVETIRKQRVENQVKFGNAPVRRSTNVLVFSSEFGDVRTVVENGQPWFVGKDIAEILGYANTRDALTKHVDNEDKGESQIATPSGTQTMTVINESGLYSLILSSKLPKAKEFKRWVTSEVLPAIRKQGMYVTEQKAEAVRSYVEEEQDPGKRQELIDFCKYMGEPNADPTAWKKSKTLRYVSTGKLVYSSKENSQRTDHKAYETAKKDLERYQLLKERKDTLSKQIEVLDKTRKALEEYDSVLVQMLLK